jgi:hypothetical protein
MNSDLAMFDARIAQLTINSRFMWDALFYWGHWIPDYATIRTRHRRYTHLNPLYVTFWEILFKASRTGFCIYASRFETPLLENACWISAVGCPVLIPEASRQHCPFGIPVHSRNLNNPNDPFTDDTELWKSVKLALNRPLIETMQLARQYIVENDLIGRVLEDDASIGNDAYWINDWQDNMIWTDWKPSRIPIEIQI